MNIRVVTASAGSGKTTRLSTVLDEAIRDGRVRPEGVVATTFTKEAAAELIERARTRLLASGRGRQAHQLLTARIGTVNSVCGALVAEFAFELGLSPALRVLDETTAQIEQDRALASVVSDELSAELQAFQHRFDHQLDWRIEVRRITEASRVNEIDATALRSCAARSIEAMDACLGPCAADDAAIDEALAAAIDEALAGIDPAYDRTKGTAAYLDLLEGARRKLAHGALRWGDWAKLVKERPCKASLAMAEGVAAAAVRHLAHPRLRREMRDLVTLLFQVAADGLAAYQAHKRSRGLIDFIDQESLALRLLRMPAVRDALAGQIDLVLVDEFQDTSPLQLAIFVELAALARESVWVGDQKQAIYGFRGTDPALMDAVIESLTGTATDPELLHEAFEAAGRAGAVETLSVSYRSRPALVALTSDVFAPAFARQGIPEARTRLRPSPPDEPPGLGPIVEHWPLVVDGRSNKDKLATAVAAGVRDLLAAATPVRDRHNGAARRARADDVAVLCRTNDQCQFVAEALARLGVAAVVARVGLLDTLEGRVATAALRLWVDPRDALAAADLARVVAYPTAADAFVDRALARPGDAFADDPIVAAVLAARAATPDLDPVGALTTILEATDLRALCAGWGAAAQRLANLDALRAQAVAYVAEAGTGRQAPTVVGLLRHLDDLVDESAWGARRVDRQALLADSEAVTVSTWHRAKGREWPLTVLFGLEALREPVAHGLHVIGDDQPFDLAAPLAGRWLRYWPHPYTTANQAGAVRDAYQASDAYARIVARSRREALRLLYVGWTRARDRLILAAYAGKLLEGILRTLSAIDPALISEPAVDRPGEQRLSWAGHPVCVHVRPTQPAPATPADRAPGTVTLGRTVPAPYPPARMSPSAAPALPCILGPPIALGPHLALRGAPDMQRLGDAIHRFLAADRADRDEPDRLDLARTLLASHAVASHLDPAALVEAGTRLWRWLEALTPSHVRREWPLAERLATGTIVSGTADLVVRTPRGLAVIDHKSFPGTLADALTRIPSFSGQLATYARALTAATGERCDAMWIHLPLVGAVVEVRLAEDHARRVAPAMLG
jgi:ATP-dependent helicase/nuclease subunit A